MQHPNILTIAGSDSGGGAGIQADLKTITCLKGYGMSVITALTAQNGAEVRGIHPVPPEFVALQYQTVNDGFDIHAAKTGMLAARDIIMAVSRLLAERDFPLVVDPVCVSQSGYKLLEDNAILALKNHMLPLADLLTPNLPEAELLSGVKIKDNKSLTEAATVLIRNGAAAVLIKGGHFAQGQSGNTASCLTDWLCLPDSQPMPLTHPRVNSPNNHGTGCTLSAAIATRLGEGFSLPEAVKSAQTYLQKALEHGFNPGRIGVGPPNFMFGE